MFWYLFFTSFILFNTASVIHTHNEIHNLIIVWSTCTTMVLAACMNLFLTCVRDLVLLSSVLGCRPPDVNSNISLVSVSELWCIYSSGENLESTLKSPTRWTAHLNKSKIKYVQNWQCFMSFRRRRWNTQTLPSSPTDGSDISCIFFAAICWSHLWSPLGLSRYLCGLLWSFFLIFIQEYGISIWEHDVLTSHCQVKTWNYSI